MRTTRARAAPRDDGRVDEGGVAVHGREHHVEVYAGALPREDDREYDHVLAEGLAAEAARRSTESAVVRSETPTASTLLESTTTSPPSIVMKRLRSGARR